MKIIILVLNAYQASIYKFKKCREDVLKIVLKIHTNILLIILVRKVVTSLLIIIKLTIIKQSA